ncbi:AmmeMemoRadiSam system protein B [Candidatus Woesearchaeota archaeon]|nr:MAG: AmmeMemoRadiSam system protein B [Candidatus Woesearchaeota archaeon]
MQNRTFAAAVLLILVVALASCEKAEEQNPVREAAVHPVLEEKNTRVPLGAGTYYPRSRETLRRVTEEYLESARKTNKTGRIRMIVAPSAPLTYSGEIAADAYAQITRTGYKRAVIVAKKETKEIGVIVPEKNYETPLGEVALDEDAIKSIENSTLIHRGNDTTMRVEAQLPFLQTVLKNFTMIPLLAGRISTNQLNQLIEVIENLTDNETLVVVSTVFSRSKGYLEAYDRDSKCLTAINRMDLTKAAIDCEASSKFSMLAALAAAKRMNLEPEIISYKTSGDTVGNKDRVTGYAAIVFREKNGEE